MAMFFDLERAYDTILKHGILQDLHRVNLRGRLPQFMANFLSDRQFKVQVNSCQQHQRDALSQELGVLQGCILLVIHYILKICLPVFVAHCIAFLMCYRLLPE